ncbi:MAG: formyltetrahydrofolate deformylase [Olpidium bornovanus]|uniref:Formyltetrahydrofolate deformylase n=1 Tax=Olpidium bornovanus TaxID=278681 RepID=A0A8H7ZNQ5_9FUNG|nr:MAG: formyltetrahydrofolate deformylase [Olpidium bornovanus]
MAHSPRPSTILPVASTSRRPAPPVRGRFQPAMRPNTTAVFLLVCPDARGIVASVTGFISKHGGNIVDSDFHIDATANLFLGRVEWSLADFSVASRDDILRQVELLCAPYGGQWSLHFSDKVQRIAIWCSKQDHCVLDLLNRLRNDDLGRAEVVLVLSNHEDLRERVEAYGIPFRTVKTDPTKCKAEEKSRVEAEQLRILKEEEVDIVVLAKYMQILSDDFVQKFGEGNIVNIHHSFLPAFVGAKPYHQAHKRGVKIIGATAHFVTAELDAGPIIEQDVVRISHRENVADLVRKGKDLERVVLARAVRLCVERRVLKYGNKTVVFE